MKRITTIAVVLVVMVLKVHAKPTGDIKFHFDSSKSKKNPKGFFDPSEQMDIQKVLYGQLKPDSVITNKDRVIVYYGPSPPSLVGRITRVSKVSKRRNSSLTNKKNPWIISKGF
jgi:hypothetical protein